MLFKTARQVKNSHVKKRASAIEQCKRHCRCSYRKLKDTTSPYSHASKMDTPDIIARRREMC